MAFVKENSVAFCTWQKNKFYFQAKKHMINTKEKKGLAMERFKKFILNGLLITGVSLLMRSVSVSFNVYISNRIGAVAMGVFTLISTVYGFAITVATSGIGFATTRIVAESGNGDTELYKNPQVRCIVKKCVTYALCFSLGSALILFLFSPIIGIRLLGDERTVMPLRVLAFTLPPIALASVLNGYFTAVRRVYKNAIVQVVGQMVRIYGCVAFLALFGAHDVESGCMAIVIGGALSEGISFLLQYGFYLFEKNKDRTSSIQACERKKIEKKVLHTALPMAFSAYVRSGLITIEHMLIPIGLKRSGSSRDQALASYGIVQSMVFPLVLFPSALSGSFAGLLIPEIAESYACQNYERIQRIIGKVFQAVLIFSIGTAGIIMCFSYDLSRIIYPGVDAGKYILMIAPLVPVMYLDTSVDAILKGMGEQVYCMGINIVDALLSVVLVWILIPNCGITGYILTVYFTEIVNATLSITRLFSVSKVKTHVVAWVLKPLLCIVIATSVMRLILSRWVGTIDSAWSLTIQIMITACLYFFCLLVTGALKLKKESRQ